MSALECPLHDEFSDLIPQSVNNVDGKFKSNDNKELPQEVSVIVCYNPLLDLILAVHRKDDPSDYGLPGGKVEFNEDPINAALRELSEETRYYTNDNDLVFLDTRIDKNYIVYVYTLDFKNLMFHNQNYENRDGWKTLKDLSSGSFGEFNKLLFEDLLLGVNLH